MNDYIEERTVRGKIYEIHDILPYIGSYVAEHGFYNLGKSDWFPSKEEWTMILDFLNTFAEMPIELSDLGFHETQDFFEALAKDYVGYHKKDDEPDPLFWSKIANKYPMCHVRKCHALKEE